MTSPARSLAADLKVRTSAQVCELHLADDRWELLLAQKGPDEPIYDAAILAVPAPQAAVLLAGVAPDLAQLAGNVSMTPCWSVMLICDESLAPLSRPASGFSEVLALAVCDSSKPQRQGQTCWLLQASAAWSLQYLEAEPNWVAKQLVEELGLSDDRAIATITAHRWRYARAPEPLSIGALWDHERQLGLCGDWLCAGTVEGAWRSGRSLAAQITAAVSAA